MNNLAHKLHNRAQRKHRIRSQVVGTTARPRLSIYISNMHISAQIIDDSKHHTLLSVSTVGQKSVTGSMVEKATWVGSEVGKKAKTAKITTVVFDRSGKLYHGRVAALAEAARKTGLEF